MDIFLTGTSGFLGGELLVSLSKRADISKIYCLIRAKDKQNAFERIEKVFSFHGDFFDKEKIIPIVGDLLDPGLADQLSENKILSDIKLIVHSAANTSFAKMNDSLVQRVNVDGLRSILEWSTTLKELETFTYIGTATICGCNVKNRIVYEDESPSQEAKHMVKYTYTKMLGEMMLKEYLPAEKILVLRPSIIMGDSRSWIPRSPVILWTLATVNLLRLLPYNPNSNVDIIPVDYAVNAIEALLFAKRKYSVYHISSGINSASKSQLITDTLGLYFNNRPLFKYVDPELLSQMKKYSKNILPLTEELFQYNDYLQYWEKAFGENTRMRIIFAALDPYIKFIELGQVFDSSRLLEDSNLGIPLPAHEYIKKSIKYLEKIDVFEGALDP
jgi:thioester reductase-like protein